MVERPYSSTRFACARTHACNVRVRCVCRHGRCHHATDTQAYAMRNHVHTNEVLLLAFLCVKCVLF